MPGATAQKVAAYQELEGRQVRLKALNLSLELKDGPLQVADRNGLPTGSPSLVAVERKKEDSRLLKSLSLNHHNQVLKRDGSNFSVSTNQLSIQQPVGSFHAIDSPIIKGPLEAQMKSIVTRAPVSNVMNLVEPRDSRLNGLHERGQTRTEESHRGLSGDLTAAVAKARQFEQQVDALMKRDRSATSASLAVQSNLQIAVQTSSQRPGEDAIAKEYQAMHRAFQEKQLQGQRKRKPTKQPETTTGRQASQLIDNSNADIKEMVDVARKIKSKNAACLV